MPHDLIFQSFWKPTKSLPPKQTHAFKSGKPSNLRKIPHWERQSARHRGVYTKLHLCHVLTFFLWIYKVSIAQVKKWDCLRFFFLNSFPRLPVQTLIRTTNSRFAVGKAGFSQRIPEPCCETPTVPNTQPFSWPGDTCKITQYSQYCVWFGN